ncbi:MAG TPA: hypothetical protein VIJ31_04790 [Acidothermaceae bacterium]
MSRVVKAPLVITKSDTGHDLYLYEGAELPAHASAAEVARLDALGFLAAEGTDPTPSRNVTDDPDAPEPANEPPVGS